MENNIEGLEAGGIKCDNPECDYRDDTVKMEDWESYVNKPCPECGENLFTEEDYNKTKNFLNILEGVMSMSEEELNGMMEMMGGNPLADLIDENSTQQTKLSYDAHNDEISFTVLNKKKEDEDE